MFPVERGLPGFSVSRTLDKMGMRASDTAELSLEECPVPAENLLGGEARGVQRAPAPGGLRLGECRGRAENLLGVEGRGFQQLAAGLQRERIMAAVLALSGATQALEDTVAYLGERSTFGAPLAGKQALRHRVADMATEIEAARQLVYRAASLHAAGIECGTTVSMA